MTSSKLTIIFSAIIFISRCFAPPLEFPPFTTAELDVSHNKKTVIKDWTLFIFIAGDNSLKGAIQKNIEELQKIGSNHRINILVRVDTRDNNEKKFTKLLYIDNGKLIQIMPDTSMDSGNPEDLISVFSMVHERYPAHHWGLVLWNHGTGFLDDPSMAISNPEEAYLWNILNKGICFDDSTHHYLTNKKLEYTLQKITALLGKKIDLLGCDACYMNMWEFLRLIQPYATFAVGSQEVEDSAGWDYYHALHPLTISTVTPQELATSIVHAYHNYYLNVQDYYTQSAIDLTKLILLDQAIEHAARIVLEGIRNYQSFKNLLQIVRKGSNPFKESYFIDLYDFFHKLTTQIKNYEPKNEAETTYYHNLTHALDSIFQSIDNAVIANVTAQNVTAHGISIYFPEDTIHPSYYYESSPEQKAWISFLEAYLESA